MATRRSGNASNVGMMEGAFFVGRGELISWVNNLLLLGVTKVEQCASGAIYCQILDTCHPNTVAMRKVNWMARSDHEYIPNYKVLQAAFEKLGIERHIAVEYLVRGKYQDNLEFLQFMKCYWDREGAQEEEYEPVSAREGKPMPDWGKWAPPVTKEAPSRGLASPVRARPGVGGPGLAPGRSALATKANARGPPTPLTNTAAAQRAADPAAEEPPTTARGGRTDSPLRVRNSTVGGGGAGRPASPVRTRGSLASGMDDSLPRARDALRRPAERPVAVVAAPPPVQLARAMTPEPVVVVDESQQRLIEDLQAQVSAQQDEMAALQANAEKQQQKLQDEMAALRANAEKQQQKLQDAVEELRAGAEQQQHKMRAHQTEAQELRGVSDGLERERDYYYKKLRDVEILCSTLKTQMEEEEEEGETDATPEGLVADIQAILYAEDTEGEGEE